MKFEKENTSAVVPVEQKPFDIGETKAMVLANAQANQAEFMALTDQLDLTNSQTLVTFGKEAVDEVSKCSDIILNNVEMDKITGAGDLVRALTTIMDKFDVKELSEVKENFLKKLFNTEKKELMNLYNRL